MNIHVCPLNNTVDPEPAFCPGCHSRNHRKHGVYLRKGFHLRSRTISIPMAIQRYRCLNTECPRCTFSILPPMVLRYCRFFWPCLLAVRRALNNGATCYHLARYVWLVGHRVIRRASAQLSRMNLWVSSLYRELTDGSTVREVDSMVKIIINKIGPIELTNRWYHHRYPLRF
jgi:hypothetical protein